VLLITGDLKLFLKETHGFCLFPPRTNKIKPDFVVFSESSLFTRETTENMFYLSSPLLPQQPGWAAHHTVYEEIEIQQVRRVLSPSPFLIFWTAKRS
jgi:hypothetical protein